MKTINPTTRIEQPIRGYLVWAIWAALVFPIQAADTTLTTVTFDLPPHPDGGIRFAENYTEQNMRFRSGSVYELERLTSGGVNHPDNGSDYLYYPHRGGSMSWGLINNYSFGMYSIDLAETTTTIFPDGSSSLEPMTVNIHGILLDGTTVSTSFTTDGICDADGPLADFETFYFDQRFAQNLTRVEIDTTAVMDNVVFFNVVPEPGTVALLTLGGLILAARWWRRA